LPKYLGEVGYVSHALGSWGLGFCHPDYLPTKRGFKTHYGPWSTGGDHQTHITAADLRAPYTTLGYDFHDQDSASLGAIGYYTSDLLVDRMSDILSEHVGLEKGFFFSGYPEGRQELEKKPEQPFMMYIAFDDLQGPLQVEEKWRDLYPFQEDETRKTYLGMLTALDDAVGRIVNHLRRMTYKEDGKERSVFDDTVIIFTSTNGALTPESPGAGGGSNKPLRGSLGDLLEGATRIPAFVSNLDKASGTIKSLFHISDWLPTIVQGMAGGQARSSDDLDGVNQVNVLKRVSMPLRTEVLYDIANFTESNYNHTRANAPEVEFELTGSVGAAIRVDDYKLVVGCETLAGCARNYNSTWGGNADIESVALYNLADDPMEKLNLAKNDTMAEKVEELRSRLDHHVSRAVLPMHREPTNDGLPIYSFPIPAQFFTSWCQAEKSPKNARK